MRVLWVLILLNPHLLESYALKCYVCGSDSNLLNCDKFSPSNQLYIKECPTESKTCFIQSRDNTFIRRSCEEDNFEDCMTANKIQYCYCSRDLCNAFDFIDPDDEDALDAGSGQKSTNTIQTSTLPTTSTAVNITQTNKEYNGSTALHVCFTLNLLIQILILERTFTFMISF